MNQILKRALTDNVKTAELVTYEPEGIALVRAVLHAFIVIRESNRYDLLAFATMVLQTLEALIHLPGVKAYLDAAGDDPALIMRPGPAGDRLRRELGASPLYHGTRVYGWTCEIEGTTFVFAMTSAMSSDDEDLKNPFTDDLIDLLRERRPSDLFAGPESRLVRRASLGHVLGDACERLGVIVHTRLHPNGIDIKTNGFLWSIICRQCEEDLKTTVSRLLTGRIYKVTRRNEWDRGEGAILVGYAVEEGGRIVLGNEQQQAIARLVFELSARAWEQIDGNLAGDLALTPESIISELAAAGAQKRSHKRVDRYGRQVAGAPLDDAPARQALLTILRDIPAYWTGTLRRRQGLPLTTLSSRDLHGLPVYKETVNGEDKGFTFFEWTLPLPEGGWANEETLGGAWLYYEHLNGQDRRGSEASWPLSGLFTAVRGSDQYRLTHNSGGYQWRRYPSGTGYKKRISQAIGKFDHEEIVRRLVTAIVSKLEVEGLSPNEFSAAGSSGGGKIAPARDIEHQELQSRRDDLQRQFDNASVNSLEAQNDTARRNWLEKVDVLGAQLEEAQHALDELPDVTQQPPPPPELELGSLATLLSVLEDTAGGPVDPAVVRILQRTIVQGTVEDCWSDDALWARFVFSLRLRVKGGWTTVGPLSFELGSSSQGTDRDAWDRRMVKAAELRMVHGMSVEDLAKRMGEQPSPRRLFKTLTQTVSKVFGVDLTMAAKMVDHPIDSTRGTLGISSRGGDTRLQRTRSRAVSETHGSSTRVLPRYPGIRRSAFRLQRRRTLETRGGPLRTGSLTERPRRWSAATRLG